LLFKFDVECHQTEQPTASISPDLQRYVIMMSILSQSHGLINVNRIALVYILGMQSKCKYNVTVVCLTSNVNIMLQLYVLHQM